MAPTTFRLQSALCGIVVAIAPMAAASQGFGRVANQPYSGEVIVINNMRTTTNSATIRGSNMSGPAALSTPGGQGPSVPMPAGPRSANLLPPLKAYWDTARPQIVDSALAFFDEHPIGGGFRTSRNTLTLSDIGPLFAGWDARGFTVRFIVPGNRFTTYLRTPTPADRNFDPGFVIHFDLEVTIDVEVKGNQLVAGPARIKPNVQRPQGKNITGDAAVAAANFLVDVLSGPDFVGGLLKQVNGRQFSLQNPLNRELSRLNPVLAVAAKDGIIMPGFDASRSSITLTLRNAGPAPVVH